VQQRACKTLRRSLGGRSQPLLPAACSLSHHVSRLRSSPFQGHQWRSTVAAGGRKGKGRGASTEPPAAVSLLEGAPGSAPLAGDTPNADAWLSGRTLRVGDELYHVVVNPPSVLKARAARLTRSIQRLGSAPAWFARWFARRVRRMLVSRPLYCQCAKGIGWHDTDEAVITITSVTDRTACKDLQPIELLCSGQHSRWHMYDGHALAVSACSQCMQCVSGWKCSGAGGGAEPADGRLPALPLCCGAAPQPPAIRRPGSRAQSSSCCACVHPDIIT